MRYIFIFFSLFFFNKLISQSLAINTDGSTANSSALLDVKSTTKGLLLPRMTKAQKNAIATPATGLLVFQTGPDSIGFHYFNATHWLWLQAEEDLYWAKNGNNIYNRNGGYVGIGINNPSQQLHSFQNTDFDKSAIYGEAKQTVTGSDYLNIGVRGFGNGGSTDWGLGIGVAGMCDPAMSWTSTGVFAGLGSAIPLIANNTNSRQAFYADANGLGYAGLFVGGNVGINTISPAAAIDVAGGFKLGTSGTVNSAIIQDLVNINVGSVPANGELDVIVPLVNVATTASVSVSPSADLPSGIIIAWARVSSAGNIKIRYRNLTGGAIDPAAINYYISAVQ